jgi:DNA-binding NarL/FixJ family response regulator
MLSDRTVKTYVSNILQKLHLSRRSEAAAFAARQRHRT